MKTGTQNQLDGKLHEVKGNIKATVGQAINNQDLEAKGKAEALAGKLQKKVGQVEQVFEK
jgi:uncharacterized protein YjbJ (UPF0337 family)